MIEGEMLEVWYVVRMNEWRTSEYRETEAGVYWPDHLHCEDSFDLNACSVLWVLFNSP